jgi:hypothetical protein
MRQKVDAFAKSHPRFDKLADEVEFWLNKKMNLDEAYYLATVLDELKAMAGGRAPP